MSDQPADQSPSEESGQSDPALDLDSNVDLEKSDESVADPAADPTTDPGVTEAVDDGSQSLLPPGAYVEVLDNDKDDSKDNSAEQ